MVPSGVASSCAVPAASVPSAGEARDLLGLAAEPRDLPPALVERAGARA